MSLYPTSDHLGSYHSYSNPPSSTSSPEMEGRADSPVDSRSKNARAQARHRAKRKAYVENLENTVHQLRAALATSGSSPDIAAQIQYLEQENARLRAESQSLRVQLGASGSPTTSTSASSSAAVGGFGAVGGSAYGAGDSSGLRLPSVADAMNLRGPSSFSQSPALPNYFQDSESGAGGSRSSRYYESTSDYRRRVSQPYIPSRRESAPMGLGTGSSSSAAQGSYDGASTSRVYDNSERISASGSTSRSSQRSYQQSTQQAPGTSTSTDPTSHHHHPQEQQGGYQYTQQQMYNATPAAVTPAFPPASGTASAYVFSNNEDVKPYVP